MSDSIIVRVHGEEFDISPPFTNRELHLIKKVSGIRAGELFDAMENGDTDLIVALAHVAVKRAGRHQPTLDMLWDLAPGEIEVSDPDQRPEAEKVPPTSTPSGGDAAGSPATTP